MTQTKAPPLSSGQMVKHWGLTKRHRAVATRAVERIEEYRTEYLEGYDERGVGYEDENASEYIDRHLPDAPIKTRIRLLQLACTIAHERGIDLTTQPNRSRDSKHAPQLTDEDAAEIRERYAEGDVLQKELAEEYGVTVNTIYRTVAEKTRAA